MKSVGGGGGKVDSNQFDSLHDRPLELPLCAPLTCICIVLRRDSETSREGHATRYCWMLQVNARGNDGSQTRRLEKYRCKCKFLRSGEVIVFLVTIIFTVISCPINFSPIFVMCQLRHPRWIYGIPLDSIATRYSRRRARGPFSGADGGAAWNDPISREFRSSGG